MPEPTSSTSFKFTAKRLDSLTPPPYQHKEGRQIVQQQYWWQGDGLGLCLSSTGAKSWVFVYRIQDHGQRRLRRDVLGVYSATETSETKQLTLRQANLKADTYRTLLQQGKDPRTVQQEHEHAKRTAETNTFLACAERFLTVYRPKKKPHLRPGTLKEYRRHLLVDFQSLHDRPLSSITKRDVNQALDQIQERIAGVGVNRCLATVRKMFNWLMERGEIDLPPTAGITSRAPELARDRHLFGNQDKNQPCEIEMFWNAAEAIGPAGALPKLLLLTGQRRNEVAKMSWDELIDLDGDNPRWLVPADRAKNWKENLVPLSPLAVRVIRSLPRVVGCRYVLSSDGVHPRSGFNTLKRKLDAAAMQLKRDHLHSFRGQLEQPWTLHDLRRTAKTGMAALGVSGDIRDALFNHAPAQRMDQVYVHAAYTAEKRQAVDAWDACISQSVSDTQAKGRAARIRKSR